MAGTCQRKAVVVAETKTGCEALLVQIVADKRVADEQEKQVQPSSLSLLSECNYTFALQHDQIEGRGTLGNLCSACPFTRHVPEISVL